MSASLKTCYGFQTSRIKDPHDYEPHYAVDNTVFDVEQPKDKKYQWLTSGYYFWMNSQANAEWWGKSRLKDNYRICRYDICIPRDRVFDLVENPEDEIEFIDLLLTYLELYEESQQANLGDQLPIPTVCTVLNYFKQKHPDIFYYWAITISDKWVSNELKEYLREHDLWMAPNSRSKSDQYKPIGRPQICVFDIARNYITNPEEILLSEN